MFPLCLLCQPSWGSKRPSSLPCTWGVEHYVQVNWDQYQAQISWKTLFLGPGCRWETWDAPWVKLVFAWERDVLRVSNLPAHEGLGADPAVHGQLSACTPNHSQALKESSAQPCRELDCRVPSHKPSEGGKYFFFFACMHVVILIRKLLRLISLDLPLEVSLQSTTFSKSGEEIESALFQNESYECRAIIYTCWTFKFIKNL